MKESNNYRDYFLRLKEYLVELRIDSDSAIQGCSDDEIKALESLYGKLPLAYIEYLKSIGRNHLFQFMDAEDMSYNSFDYIKEFGEEVFQENDLKLERPHLVISERRNEYITMIYLDEAENPKTWIMSECWDESKEGNNLEIRAKSFISLMTGFFRMSLINTPFSFNFVDSKLKNPEKVIKTRYDKWSVAVSNINNRAKEEITDNVLIKELNQTVIDHYNPNQSKFKEVSKSKLDDIKNEIQEKARNKRRKERLFTLITISVILIAILIFMFK